ncbi:MAG TPA: MATE family efflux transporter, partial [Bacteroidales bacterium]|nr:MATE family efflux transporter [Bacteroidales bacterium]
AAAQAILAGVFVAIILALPGIFYSYELLRLMGATHELAAANHGYTRIMFAGNVVIVLLFV